MTWIAIVFITVLAGLTVRSSEPVPLKSLCVLDDAGACWIDKKDHIQRTPQPGDYILSPEDMNKIIEKLKSVQ